MEGSLEFADTARGECKPVADLGSVSLVPAPPWGQGRKTGW